MFVRLNFVLFVSSALVNVTYMYDKPNDKTLIKLYFDTHETILKMFQVFMWLFTLFTVVENSGNVQLGNETDQSAR